MRFTLSILWLVVLGYGLGAQTQRFNIAVNDLVAKGIAQSDAEIISERLRSELLNTGLFKVMERTDMAVVLKEQGFQQSGVCDEASCLVEVGQVLGVERMVSGSVGQIGSIHTIALRMVSVMTGEILYYVNEDYQGELSGMLTTAVAQAARKLARSAAAELSGEPLSPMRELGSGGSLPEGRIVDKDGIRAEGQSAVTQPVFGRLSVVSVPAGAQVYLNEQPIGLSPYADADMQPGTYQLRVALDGYEPAQENLSVVNDTSITKSYVLQHTRAYLDSVKIAEVKISKRRQMVRRIVFGSLAAGAFGGGLYMNAQTAAAADVYHANQSEDGAVHDKNWDTYTTHVRNRSLLYGVGGVFAACFVLSIPF